MQMQTVVTGYMKSKQLLLFALSCSILYYKVSLWLAGQYSLIITYVRKLTKYYNAEIQSRN